MTMLQRTLFLPQNNLPNGAEELEEKHLQWPEVVGAFQTNFPKQDFNLETSFCY